MTHHDQTTQESIITLLRACGFDMHNIKHGQHQVKGTVENAIAFFKLVVAGADANVVQQRPAPAPVLVPATTVHDQQELESIGKRLRRIAKAAGVTVEHGDDAAYYAGAFSILGDIARELDKSAASVQSDNISDTALLEVGTMYITQDGSRIPSLRWPCRLLDGGEYTLYVQRDLGAHVPKSESAAVPMTLERFSEKMDALDAANPTPLEHLLAAQGGKVSTP